MLQEVTYTPRDTGRPQDQFRVAYSGVFKAEDIVEDIAIIMGWTIERYRAFMDNAIEGAKQHAEQPYFLLTYGNGEDIKPTLRSGGSCEVTPLHVLRIRR